MPSSSPHAADETVSDRLGRVDLPEGYPEVFGKYVLVRPMARGGMGELFIAASGETGGFEKLCVVKKVLHSLEDGAVHRRFLDEAKVVVRLNHANLVQVFDAGKVNEEYYLAMELVEGKDLRAVWNRCAQLHRRIPVDIAIFVVREVLRGLHYVHDAMGLDLVHRDISPPNVLVGYRGDVKLTDFGLAKSSIKREMTSPGVVFGRYSYLSPEQAKGLPADRRTDIYACAIVLWELLTGRQLFPSGGRSHTEALDAVRNPKAEAPSSLVPGIPDGLDEIVLRGLTRDREDRYQAAGDFRAALSDILAKNFPAADADRVAEFMRDIFAREAKMEQRDYLELSSHDFSDLRAQGEESELISISDVVASLHQKPRSTMELGESDIVELEGRGGRRWDERPDAASLAEAAGTWVGRVISQRYRVESLIGVGGMGAVFRVKHLVLGKTFALKVLHSHYTRDADVITRFMREARAASQTGHPHIIDVLDVGTNDEGDVYFVMELLEGQNLGEAIKREGPLAVRRAVHIARQVCQALSAAHAAGIIHRDLKSENIILTPRGKDPDFVKVLDFGICKQMDGESETTSPGLIMGSPDYMAPEQGAGLDATIASDIYALGCILFEMLTGRMPFQGRNAVDVLMQKGAREADTVTVYRPEVPNPVASAIGRCLKRQPGDRPPSMRSLEYELTRAIDGRASAVANVLGMEASDERPDDAGASLSMNRAAIATMGEGVYGRDYEQQDFTQIAPPPRDPAALTNSQPVVPPPGTPQAALSASSDPVEVAPAESRSPVRGILLVALGGALALGVLAVAMPGGLGRLFGDGSGDRKGDDRGTQEPTASKKADPAVVPAPTPPQRPAAVAPAKTDVGTAGGQAEDTAAAQPGGEEVPPGEPSDVPAEVPAGEPPVAPAAPVADDDDEDPQAIVALAEAALEAQRWTTPSKDSLASHLSRLQLLAPGDESLARLRKAAAETLLPEGDKALKKKRWADAVVAYRNLRSIWPDHAEAREGLLQALAGQARVLRKLDDHEGGLASADEWLNVQPNSFDALMLRGDMLYALSRWAEAKEAYRLARKEKPRSKAAKEKFFKASRRARKAK
ncbi:MAG: protein kinase domain-containing protein [Nannocystales bacterium]